MRFTVLKNHKNDISTQKIVLFCCFCCTLFLSLSNSPLGGEINCVTQYVDIKDPDTRLDPDKMETRYIILLYVYRYYPFWR